MVYGCNTEKQQEEQQEEQVELDPDEHYVLCKDICEIDYNITNENCLNKTGEEMLELFRCKRDCKLAILNKTMPFFYWCNWEYNSNIDNVTKSSDKQALSKISI